MSDEHSTRLGITITSGILLKDSRVKHVIVNSLLGLLGSGSMYTLESCKWDYAPIYDVVYLPNASHCKELPPIPVVMQSVIDRTFMEKSVQYCICLYNLNQALPVVLVISIEGYSSQEFKSNFKSIENEFVMETNSLFWAKCCFIISSESILGFIDEHPMHKLVALTSCFIDTEKCSQSDDPSIKYFMNIVNEKE